MKIFFQNKGLSKANLSKQNMILYILIIAFVFALAFSYIKTSKSSENSSSTPLLTDTQIALDTVISISIYDSSDESILNGAFDLCKSYETVFSRTNSESELYQFNESTLLKQTVSDDLASLIETGLKYSQLSDGSFDITIAPISELWDFKSDNPVVPDADKIAEALNYVDYHNISVNGSTISKSSSKDKIDLGAIAKGYIADRIKDYLLDNNVKSAVINLGGNILLVGSKPDGSDFNVGIQTPFEDQSKTIAAIKISDKSIVTSGIYERYFVQDDKLYHHILNPKTGYPYDNDLLSVTIISDESIDGDALSTTCFALGLEKGMEYIESQDGLDAIFITSDGSYHYSDGIFKRYDITETE